MAVEGADRPSPAASPNGVFRIKPDGGGSRSSRGGDGQHVTAEGVISCSMTVSSFIDALAASTRHPAGARSASVADGAITHARPRSAPRAASASLTSRHLTPADHAVSLRRGSRYADASTQPGQGEDAPRRPRSASRRPARDPTHAVDGNDDGNGNDDGDDDGNDDDDDDDDDDEVEEMGERGAGGRDDADGRAGATDPLAATLLHIASPTTPTTTATTTATTTTTNNNSSPHSDGDGVDDTSHT